MKHPRRNLTALLVIVLSLCLCQSALAVGAGGMGARSLPQGTDVFLGGNYIEIGVSSTGSFGTKSAAPASGGVYFHPNNTDVQSYTNSIGLRSNGQGWEADGAPNPDQTKDFFLPGKIDEGFLIGWSTAAGSKATVQGIGSEIGNPSNSAITNQQTADDSTAELLKATTTGTVNNAVNYTQVVSFKPDDKQFKTDITLTNTTGAPIYNLTYVRRFDPDQNVQAGEYKTDNFFIKDEAGVAWTIASTKELDGTGSGLRTIDRQTALANAENVFSFYANDRRAESVYGSIGFTIIPDGDYVGDKIYGKHIYDDRAIGHMTKLGTLPAGESVTFTYYSSLDPDIASAINKAEDVTVVVTLQPVSRTFVQGQIDGTLRTMGEKLIEGKAYNELQYQWYEGTSMVSGGGTAIAGATGWDYAIPTGLGVNTYYYYCEVTDPASGKTAVSNVARINVVPAGSTIYSVNFDPNLSGVTVTDMPVKQTVVSGGLLLDLGSPSAAGYGFTGWYTETGRVNRWDFETPVNASRTLYAGWTNAFTATNPANVTAYETQNATFVTSGPAGATYQWQRYRDGRWADVTGVTLASGTIPAVTLADDGASFRCAVAFGGETIYTKSATLSVKPVPFTVSGPGDQAATERQPASFAVTATAATPSYQWQEHTGTDWADIMGANADTYAIDVTTMVMNGRKFRCQVTAEGVTVSSNEATLTVNALLFTITDPANATVDASYPAAFTVSVTGTAETVTYQWEEKADDTAVWASLTSENEPVYRINRTVTGDNGKRFRCKLTVGANTYYTLPALLTVRGGFTADDPADRTVYASYPAAFVTVARGATGTIAYQWQQLLPAAVEWTDAPGGNEAAYSIERTTAAQDGTRYRCKVTAGGSNYLTNSALLTVRAQTFAASDPAAQAVFVTYPASFSTVVTGATGAVSYQWQERASTAASWADVAVGGDQATYTIARTVLAGDGKAFRCRVTMCAETYLTTAAPLTVRDNDLTVVGPEDQIAYETNAATFTVTARVRAALGYQWQELVSGSWTDMNGERVASLTISNVSLAADNGRQFRCRVDNGGKLAITNAATLTVRAIPFAVTEPADQNVYESFPASFSVTVTGAAGTVAYQWQQKAPAADWANVPAGGNEASYRIDSATAAQSGTRYRCKVTVGGIGSVTNDALLTVQALPFTFTQPQDQSVLLGGTARFSTTVHGVAAPACQWQIDTGDGVWRDIAGATGREYAMHISSMEVSGYRFRCQVSGRDVSVYTQSALLTVIDGHYVPKTGDRTPIGLIALTLCFSGAGLCAVGKKRRYDHE